MFVIALTMGIALLTGCGSSQGDQSKQSASAVKETVKASAVNQGANAADNKYAIYVLDAETEEPMQGVRVKFCSDTLCMMGKTDANGCASFDSDPGNYTAHILKAPEGYEKNDEELVLTAEVRTATFKLTKAK